MLRWSYRSLAILRFILPRFPRSQARSREPDRTFGARIPRTSRQPPAFAGSFHQPLILSASWTQPARLDPDASRSPKPGSCHHSSGSFRDSRRRGLTRARSDLPQARPKSSKPHHAQLRTAVSGMGACASGTRDPSPTRSFRSYVSLFETGHGSGGTQGRGPFLIRPRSGS
jgi:hypothetical protein